MAATWRDANQAALRGDLVPAAGILDTHRARLVALAARQLHNPSEAEDIVSDAIAETLKQLSDGTSIDSGIAWLRQVVLRDVRDSNKAARNRLRSPLVDTGHEDDAMVRVETHEARSLVRKGLARLDAMDSEILQRSDFQPNRVIAAAMQLTPAYVSSRRQQATRRLGREIVVVILEDGRMSEACIRHAQTIRVTAPVLARRNTHTTVHCAACQPGWRKYWGMLGLLGGLGGLGATVRASQHTPTYATAMRATKVSRITAGATAVAGVAAVVFVAVAAVQAAPTTPHSPEIGEVDSVEHIPSQHHHVPSPTSSPPPTETEASVDLYGSTVAPEVAPEDIPAVAPTTTPAPQPTDTPAPAPSVPPAPNFGPGCLSHWDGTVWVLDGCGAPTP